MSTPGVATTETMRQLRVAIRTAMNGRTMRQAAGLAGVSPNTLRRVLRGKNVTVLTVARLCEHLGATLQVSVQRNHNM